MADIRIKDLATTAASTASDDFIAVDGSANGTRKLNAYSPTFGGNLTVSGTGTSSVAGGLLIRATTGPGGVFTLQHGDGSADTRALFWPSSVYALSLRNGAGTGSYYIGATASSNPDLVFSQNSGVENMRLNASGNLGIQTTNPGAQLEIGGTNPEIRLGPVSTSSGAYMSYNTAGNYFSLNAVTQGVGYRKLVFANDGGNVLIGTTTDGGQKLQVNGTMSIYGASTADTFTVTRASSSANGMLKFITTSTEDWIVGQRNTSDSDFHFYSYGISADALKLERSTGNATFAGSIQTAAPSGGSAIAWKLGVRVLATTTLDTTQYLQVDVGGTLYKVALVTS